MGKKGQQGNIKNHPSKANERLGLTKINRQGFMMTIVEYKNVFHIVVEFDDAYKTRVNTTWDAFDKKSVDNPNYRLGIEGTNFQNVKMKIVKYNKSRDMYVQFDDQYQCVVKTTWDNFKVGKVYNPGYPTVYGVGIVGDKYQTSYRINNKTEQIKEYNIWCGILQRCFDEKTKETHSTYKDVTCCEEWLYFPDFYEWLHSQENFEKWIDGKFWAIDKDILIKGNKIYSPDTCCLVPPNVNALFTKSDKVRGDLPIGVSKHKKCKDGYSAMIIYGKKDNRAQKTTYQYSTIEDAFLAHKESKEAYIKRIAQEEYDKGNITEKCYNAMMSYEVEITD